MTPLRSGVLSWALVVGGVSWIAGTAADLAALAIVVAIGCTAASIVTVATLYREDQQMPNPNRGQSRTAPGVLRRRAARLAQLGIISSCVPDDPDRPRLYAVASPAGEVSEVLVRDMPAYLDGLAAGHHAARSGGAS